MRLYKSGEDYLEAILILEQKRGCVRSSDAAEWMKVTKLSVTNATLLLKEGGFLTMDGRHPDRTELCRASDRNGKPDLVGDPASGRREI